MDLFVLRHGRAVREPPRGGSDRDRSLSSRGRGDTERTAGWIRESGLIFDTIGTSPYLRAVETATIIADAIPLRNHLEVWEELAPGGEREDIMDRIYRSGESVLIVGHEPMLSSLVSDLISGGTAQIHLGKGGLARIGNLTMLGRGELIWLLTRDCMGSP
ncbi:MAG: phosphohistidine phosphatase SixA [Methanoregulaceae archaeon]|nr:phosphohistidine phosphatase SixA [Methanoregulaceae archaeon]